MHWLCLCSEFFALYAECAEKLEEDAKKTHDKSRSVEVTTLYLLEHNDILREKLNSTVSFLSFSITEHSGGAR